MLAKLRSYLFSTGYALATLVYGLLVPLIMLLPALVAHRIIVTWCWLIVRWLRLTCGVRYQIIGKENLTNIKGNCVILAKHQSTWETFKLQSLCWPCATILKKELLSIPFFGWGLRCLQPIAIDRSNPREALKQVKQQGIARLQSGLNVLLFPEGTRMAPGEKGKYARSGADIALAAGVPIVPVALNAGHLWPPGEFVKQPGLVTVVIGEAIATEGKTSRELTEQTEQWIENEMKKLN